MNAVQLWSAYRWKQLNVASGANVCWHRVPILARIEPVYAFLGQAELALIDSLEPKNVAFDSLFCATWSSFALARISQGEYRRPIYPPRLLNHEAGDARRTDCPGGGQHCAGKRLPADAAQETRRAPGPAAETIEKRRQERLAQSFRTGRRLRREHDRDHKTLYRS